MSKECGSQGALSTLLAIPTGGTFDVNSARFDFVAEDVGLIETQPGGKGLTGRLDPNVEHVRDGPGYVRGRVMMHVSAKELEFWLPYILRGTKTVNDHIPGDLSPELDILAIRDQVSFRYNKLQVNSAMFRATTDVQRDEPQLLQMTLDLVGVEEVEEAPPGTLPAVPNTNVLYWLSADAELTLGATTYPFEAFNLLISNHLAVLMRNALRPQCIRSTHRSVRFQPRLPLSTESAMNLIWTKLDGAGSLNFDSNVNLGVGTSQTLFTFDRLRGPRRSPQTRGRTETFHDLDLIAWAGTDAVANPVVKVTNIHP